MKRLLRLLQMVAEIFFSYFFDSRIFLNCPLSLLSFPHISPSFTLFSSVFILRFFVFNSSVFSHRSVSLFSACSLTSRSSLSVNGSEFFYRFLFTLVRLVLLFEISRIFRELTLSNHPFITVCFE